MITKNDTSTHQFNIIVIDHFKCEPFALYVNVCDDIYTDCIRKLHISCHEVARQRDFIKKLQKYIGLNVMFSVYSHLSKIS